MNYRGEDLQSGAAVSRFGGSAIFFDPRCEVFIATGVGLGVAAVAGTAAGVAAGIGTAGTLLGIASNSYSLATKPGSPPSQAKAATVQAQVNLAKLSNYQKVQSILTKQIAQLTPPAGQVLPAAQNAKLAALKAQLVSTNSILNDLKDRFYPEFKAPAEKSPAKSSSPAVFSGAASSDLIGLSGASGLSGGGSGGGAFTGSAATPSPVSPQMIIAIVVVAAVGGSVLLAALKKKGNKL